MLHLERLVGIDGREVGKLEALLGLLGSKPFTERAAGRLSLARMGRNVPDGLGAKTGPERIICAREQATSSRLGI